MMTLVQGLLRTWPSPPLSAVLMFLRASVGHLFTLLLRHGKMAEKAFFPFINIWSCSPSLSHNQMRISPLSFENCILFSSCFPQTRPCVSRILISRLLYTILKIYDCPLILHMHTHEALNTDFIWMAKCWPTQKPVVVGTYRIKI